MDGVINDIDAFMAERARQIDAIVHGPGTSADRAEQYRQYCEHEWATLLAEGRAKGLLV